MSNGRRNFIAGGVLGLASAGAWRLAGQSGLLPPDAKGLYGVGHSLTYAAHRLLTGPANAREFSRDQISKIPHPNGKPPQTQDFLRLQANGFADWQLQVDGLVSRPGSFSLAALRAHPSRSQITQLICEEGWSYIAEWTGTPLAHLLELTGAQPKARYMIAYAMDGWADSIDMHDARHPQTLLTYGMNGTNLPVAHGGPLRLRVPRQLGYKSLKYVNRITFTDQLKEEASDYSWYAGI